MRPERRNPCPRWRAEVILASVTLFWGATFPVVKEAVQEVPVLCFLWIRFALAALILAAWAGRSLATLDRRTVGRGIVLGVLLFGAYLFQTFGLAHTTASNAGFITGLNVVWVPLLAGPVLGKPPAPGARVGVILAIVGLATLTWQWPWRLEAGDALVAVCSGFIALHILGLDVWTREADGRALAFVQIATMAALGFLGSLGFEPVTWPRVWTPSLASAVVTTSIFATVYAFWAMTTFQKLTTPTRAALIYTLEPVFSAVFSVWLAGERLSTTAWAGGALILGGMVLAEMMPGRSTATRMTAI